MKRILSLWLPHWSIERLKRCEPGAVPDNSGSDNSGSDNSVPSKIPFALTSKGVKGVILTALNAHAQKQGLRPGQRLTDARAITPALITRPSEPERDREALLKLAHWATRWGPYVNCDSEDAHKPGLWIDVTGVAHLFGGEPALLHDIETRLGSLGLTARLGLADTFGAAWALARYAPHYGPQHTVSDGTNSKDCHPHPRIAPKGKTKTALKNLPLDALRLNPDIIQLLKRLGLYRVADIYDLPRSSLKTRFSSRQNAEAVLLRLDQALGQMKEPRSPLSEPATHEARRAYPEPLISGEGVETAIKELAIELTDNLAKLCLGARLLRLTIYRVDASSIKISIHQHAPSRAPEHIIRLFHEKLTRYDAGHGIDLITLGAFDCTELSHAQNSFDTGNEVHSKNAINGLVDRFENRLGLGTTYRLSPDESHIPERAQSRQGTQGDMTEKPDANISWPDHNPPRPPLLLRSPEPITVMAEIPEGPPAQFTWRRTIHRITRAEGPERIAPEWWREIGQKQTCVRDYYRVEDLHGQRYWLFRNGLYDAPDDELHENDTTSPIPTWYMHGLFG